MFWRTIRIALLIMVTGLAVACGETITPEDPFEPSISTKESQVSSDDGFVYVIIGAKGEWTIDLQYPAEGPSDWATMDPASGVDVPPAARLRFSQNESEESRTVTLVLNNRGKQVSTTVEQLGHSEPVPPPGPTPGAYGYGEDVCKADWLELPETKAGDGCELLIHDMEGKKYTTQAQSGVRNWSCYWSYDEHVSYWVAYPHNSALIGKGSRSDAWGVFDPIIPSSMQPNMGYTYGGGWTRGHQIASADRYISQANRSTFYPTNMTPQDYDFNAKIWANLENQIRNYASTSDTLYVVTGCVLEGSNTYSGNNSGFTVKVPASYFKAALQKSTSTSVGYSGWRAAAWYMPHDSGIATGNYKSYVMTVDALEAKLGYDLFVNLPAKVGKDLADKIEADCNWAK